jgi:hypothetical protein
MMKSKLIDGMLVLLDSSSQEVVYYCLGGLLNFLQEPTFKYILLY